MGSRWWRRWTMSIDPQLYHGCLPSTLPIDAAATRLQWLGTAGFRIVHDDKHFWLDPHLSRHSPRQLLTGAIAPELAKIVEHVDAAHGVAVGHGHFDHALDAPAIAQLHGCPVFGSEDTLNWCRGYGLPESQLRLLQGNGPAHQVGPFTLSAIPSLHSPLFAGQIPFPGRIERPLTAPAPMRNWRVGETLVIKLQTPRVSILHVGSAALIDAELQGVQADVVLACTIGRHATPGFVPRLLDALRPKLVIPCHWDQFWRPLTAPVRQIPGNDLQGFIDEVRRHPTAPELRVLPLLGWTSL